MLAWSVTFRNIGSELSLQKNLIPEGGNTGQLFEMFPSHAVKFLLDFFERCLMTDVWMMVTAEHSLESVEAAMFYPIRESMSTIT